MNNKEINFDIYITSNLKTGKRMCNLHTKRLSYGIVSLYSLTTDDVNACNRRWFVQFISVYRKSLL